MIFGNIAQYERCIQARHSILDTAFAWIKQLPEDCAPRVYELHAHGLSANVHGYETKSRDSCRFESHRIYVDLQYCISGGEIIEWCHLDGLTMRDDYSAERDVAHYHLPSQSEAVLRMTAGSFGIFFPEDGHMPKIMDGTNPHVKKLVIKIDQALLR